jgi:colanic acid/amylovoran biosynthesis glycosyltransferase
MSRARSGCRSRRSARLARLVAWPAAYSRAANHAVADPFCSVPALHAQPDDGALRIAYLVSRFPLATETFIARELTQVASDCRIHATLLSLFPGDATAAPEDALPWTTNLVTASPASSLFALLMWLCWSPGKLLCVIGAIVWDYRGQPSVLARALVTALAALSHARVVRQNRIAHVHAHFATYPALAAWMIARLTGVTFSFTGHAHDLYIHQMGVARRAQAARFVVAISQFNRGFVAALAGTRVRQVVVRYGLNLDRYQLRARPVARDGPCVAMVSSFRDYKGHRVLVDALACHPGLGELKIILVGDGPLRDEIEQRARALGVLAQLEFRGWVRDVDVRQILLQVDALVQPSIVAASGDTEGLPNTLIEAMALGIPVIGTNVSGVSELIDDGRNGLMVEAGNPAALANALLAVIADPGSAYQRVLEGRKTVERQHDLAVQSGLLVNLFLETGASPQATSPRST